MSVNHGGSHGFVAEQWLVDAEIANAFGLALDRAYLQPSPVWISFP